MSENNIPQPKPINDAKHPPTVLSQEKQTAAQAAKKRPSPVPLDSSTLWIRTLVISLIVLLFAIPQAFISEIISSRKDLQAFAFRNIAQAWGTAQTVAAPVLVIPYDTYIEETTYITQGKETIAVPQKKKSEIKFKLVLPETLNIQADVATEKRTFNIYTYPVYTSTNTFIGTFSIPERQEFDKYIDDVYWDDAYLSVGITDQKGINNLKPLVWDGKESTRFTSGPVLGGVLSSGFHMLAPLTAESPKKSIPFTIQFALRGTDNLAFCPLGETTNITINSNWAHPSFNGPISPETRSVTDDGFKAAWIIPHIARNYPQIGNLKDFLDNSRQIEKLTALVSFHEPVTTYRQVERSIKYSLLFIGLTFVTLFIAEIKRKTLLHFLQYGLIGFSMSLFYLTLLSLAEHISFDLAFATASGIIVLMNSFYVAAAMKNIKTGFMTGCLLALLYFALYLLLGMEKYALLAGTMITLFITATLMFVTRNLGKQKA